MALAVLVVVLVAVLVAALVVVLADANSGAANDGSRISLATSLTHGGQRRVHARHFTGTRWMVQVVLQGRLRQQTPR